MLSKDTEKEIRSAMEVIKEFKHGVDVIGARLSDIDDRLSEPAYSKEFVDEFKSCCYRLAANPHEGGTTMPESINMFGRVYAPEILSKYSAEEIVSKFREFDKKKELERDRTFLIGDEVEHTITHSKGIVLQESLSDNIFINIWRTDGGIMTCARKELFKKTGTRFISIDYWVKTELKKEEK